ncbi:hypothetical protein [Desulfuromonas thiophila]|uniref:Phage XkdN-like tail assembly chaperone protein, TAC n=1 Tax=Desulfuromonas thiophila TaxID=57664 RepID=A0A1G7B1B4_9BACT|nr:hypothetical protein [Desulfuromonas thiophila]SDE20879.1 hypothetical protein SAMN05661003_10516 [Desulfuromonas thiophila]
MKLQKMTQAWFDLPGDPDGAAFEIKHLRAGEIAKITEATSKRRFEFRKGESGELEPIPIFETDGAGERERVIAEAVAGWKNILDADGAPLECTAENRLRLCRELSEADFAALVLFVQDCRRKLAAEIKKQDEAREKN